MSMDESEARMEARRDAAYHRACNTHYSERSIEQQNLIDSMEEGENEEENDNCLAGMKCPSCGSLGPYKIAATAWFIVHDSGTDDHEDVEWDDSAACICDECKHVATVAEFKGQAAPAEDGVPKLYIGVQGGLVTGVSADRKVRVLVFDYDERDAGGTIPYEENVLVDKDEVADKFDEFAEKED